MILTIFKKTMPINMLWYNYENLYRRHSTNQMPFHLFWQSCFSFLANHSSLFSWQVQFLKTLHRQKSNQSLAWFIYVKRNSMKVSLSPQSIVERFKIYVFYTGWQKKNLTAKNTVYSVKTKSFQDLLQSLEVSPMI